MVYLYCQACGRPITDGRFDLMYWGGKNRAVHKGGCPTETTPGSEK